MRKYIAILILGLIALNPISAQKDLSLEQAVMGQYQQFYPNHVFGFNWIDGNKTYAYLKQYRTLVIGEVGGEEKEVLTIQEVNETLGVEFFYFSGLQWRDEHTILLTHRNSIVTFNIKTKEGSKIELPENAERVTFDHQKMHVAYTIDNNLYYSSVDKYEHIAVTENEDANIVSGQEIARSEMGITQGIFWSPSGKHLAFYQKDETYVHDYPLLDIDAYPGELKSIKYPMAGQASERAKLGIYSLENATSNFIQAQNGVENYLTNVAWTPDENYILLAEVARSQKHIWVQKYKADGEFVKTLFEEKKDTWVEPEKPAYFPSENSNDFVWVSERDGFDNLYYYSSDGELQSQLTENDFMLKEVVV